MAAPDPPRWSPAPASPPGRVSVGRRLLVSSASTNNQLWESAISTQSAQRLAVVLGDVDAAIVAVGLARCDQLPDGVAVRTLPAAAACAFWRAGAVASFAVGSDHGACAVGRLTQGFAGAVPADDAGVGLMVASGYVDPAEFTDLATLPMGHLVTVYGPLGGLPVDPEAALLLLRPAALMVLTEALGRARLDRPGLRLMGRPTCAAIATALLEDVPVASLACAGARLHADMDDSECLLVVPAAWFERLADALPSTLTANRMVAEHNQAAAVAAGR